MDPIIKKQRIASLILKEKIDELSKSEKEELTSWLQASPKNKKIYARLQEKSFSEDIARYQQISTTRGLDNYRRRTNDYLANGIGPQPSPSLSSASQRCFSTRKNTLPWPKPLFPLEALRQC